MSEHDPFAPSDPNPSTLLERRATDAKYAEFPEKRWRGAGATDEQIVELQAAHDARSVEEQAAEGQRLAGLSRKALAAELAAAEESGSVEHPYGATVDEVKDNVGEDPEKAAAALEWENAQPKQRKTLVEHLQRIVDVAVEEENDGDAADGAAPVE